MTHAIATQRQATTTACRPTAPRRPQPAPAALLVAMALVASALTACMREPDLHLYSEATVVFDLPVIDLSLEVYWDYELTYGTAYDWRTEWYYGWDETDRELFGEIGYTEPAVFNLRRYYTAREPLAPHTQVLRDQVEGTHFRGHYDWGFWDILTWNDIHTLDGVQSLVFDETTTLDSVTAYTNQSMHASRYHAPRYTRSFYEPEALFAAYTRGIEVNENLDGFTYDAERQLYVRRLDMLLHPVTYIYLTQIILHNNRGRIAAVDGSANLSGMARSTCVNSGRAGDDAITVYYNCRLKRDCPLLPYSATATAAALAAVPRADIVGGRLMTFGICGSEVGTITRADELHDPSRHYMDVNMQFATGMDSTFVFDVTEQVRRRYKGGVITVELDMDTVPTPARRGGSGFDAVVKDVEDGGTYEFDI